MDLSGTNEGFATTHVRLPPRGGSGFKQHYLETCAKYGVSLREEGVDLSIEQVTEDAQKAVSLREEGVDLSPVTA